MQENPTFSILHTHFYKKKPTSICLFYHLFYLNNYFSHFLLLFPTSPTTLPNFPKIYLTLSISLFSTFFLFLFLVSSFFFSFSFLHLWHLHLLLLILILLLFLFLFELIMASDFGFAILVVILGRFFPYMDGDFGALHWLLLLLLLLLQHLVLLIDPSTDPLSLSLLVCPCVGVFGFVVSVVDFVVDFLIFVVDLVVDFWFCVCGSVCIRGRRRWWGRWFCKWRRERKNERN